MTFIIWLDKLYMADPKCLRQFVERNNRGIAATALETAQVLLTEP